jgi:hypothetical protein
MARRVKRGWNACQFDAAEVAKTLGVHGKSSALKAANERHRAQWRDAYIKRYGRDPTTGEIARSST